VRKDWQVRKLRSFHQVCLVCFSPVKLAIETNVKTRIRSPSKFEPKIMFTPSIGKNAKEKNQERNDGGQI